MALRVLFFGTPAFAVPSLTALFTSRHLVAGVVCQPDRPAGRGHKMQIGAIKRAAIEHDVPVLQPTRLKDPVLLADLAALQPDLAVVAAYGRILPQPLLDLPRLGFINVHASLLPRWRGAAPIHRAILAGDNESGVTIMRVVLALDAGPTLAHVKTPIAPNETSEDLETRLAAMGAERLIDVVDRLEHYVIEEVPQDDSLSTYAARLERSDSAVSWSRPALVIHNQIRGLHPWPLASTTFSGRRLLLRRSIIEHADATGAEPGAVLAVRNDGLVVAAAPGAVCVTEVQPEGRRAMAVRDFLNGTPVAPGDIFGGL